MKWSRCRARLCSQLLWESLTATHRSIRLARGDRESDRGRDTERGKERQVAGPLFSCPLLLLSFILSLHSTFCSSITGSFFYPVLLCPCCSARCRPIHAPDGLPLTGAPAALPPRHNTTPSHPAPLTHSAAGMLMSTRAGEWEEQREEGVARVRGSNFHNSMVYRGPRAMDLLHKRKSNPPHPPKKNPLPTSHLPSCLTSSFSFKSILHPEFKKGWRGAVVADFTEVCKVTPVLASRPGKRHHVAQPGVGGGICGNVGSSCSCLYSLGTDTC